MGRYGRQAASFAGKTMPRHSSPCGATLDADQTLLMRSWPGSSPINGFQCRSAKCCSSRSGGMARRSAPSGAMHRRIVFSISKTCASIGSISQFGAAATPGGVTNAAANDRAHEVACTAAAEELADLTVHRKLAVADREKGEFLATLTDEFRKLPHRWRSPRNHQALGRPHDQKSAAR